MRRASLYSSSNRPRPSSRGPASGASAAPPAAPQPPAPPGVIPSVAPVRRAARTRAFFGRHQWLLSIAAGALIALAIVYGNNVLHPLPRALTQEDFDGAVMHTLENNTVPSQAARAYEAIRGSVVRVREFEREGGGDSEELESGVGTGVVIVDKGVILTNLHVVAAAKRVGVVFADGTESEATVIATQPENDLAVLQAKTIPD